MNRRSKTDFCPPECSRFTRPLATSLETVRQLIPFAEKLGQAWLRRILFLDMSPNKALRQVRDIVDVMDETSKEIFKNKKNALARGDEAVVSQIGQGKDILSILSAFSFFIAVWKSRCLMPKRPLTISVKANMKADENEKMPDSEVLGHMKCVHQCFPPSTFAETRYSQ